MTADSQTAALSDALAPDAIDEAFAALPNGPDENHRVDSPAEEPSLPDFGASVAAQPAADDYVFHNLSHHIAALDHQCTQLAHLLERLERVSAVQ